LGSDRNRGEAGRSGSLQILEALMTAAASVNPPTPGSRPRRRTLYRGDPGMWAWVLHRITGATIFFFLFVHVLDTAMVRVSPQAYTEVIGTYKTPIVGLMELALVATVLYHGFNGVRVILIDFWWRGPRYQRLMLWVIGVVWLLVMVPATVVTAAHMVEYFR
jgi:succinate dehydrogenase / fumarate reductase cytochrome b subunit